VSKIRKEAEQFVQLYGRHRTSFDPDSFAGWAKRQAERVLLLEDACRCYEAGWKLWRSATWLKSQKFQHAARYGANKMLDKAAHLYSQAEGL